MRVGAVSYLNTLPLVYGMLHGPQRAQVKLEFSLPSMCAQRVETGMVDIGLVPVAEIERQGLEIVSGVGIASRGAVRSILLLSKVPWNQVRTLAADAGSRTSVQLARVILRERFGVQPATFPNEPDLERMLQNADAALIIGDPALRIDPQSLPYRWLDLGAEWMALTGLPFVFAAWAGKPGLSIHRLQQLTCGSYADGREHLVEIAEAEYVRRGVSKDLALRYLRDHLWFEIGPREQEGLATFLRLARLPVAA